MDIEHREVIVVGAGPAGTTCAQRLAEDDIDVLILERRAIVGNPAQCGECIPNWEEVVGTFHGLDEHDWLKQSFEFPDRIQLHRLDHMRVFSQVENPTTSIWTHSLDIGCNLMDI